MSGADADGLLVINGGSSSVRCALYQQRADLPLLVGGTLERIGSPDARLTLHTASAAEQNVSRTVDAPDHATAARLLVNWLKQRPEYTTIRAVGHRIVHGGANYSGPELITPTVIAELQRLSPFVPQHLPAELALLGVFQAAFPDVPHVACFDTAFHHGMPRVAQILPLPRRYARRGLRRYGFHGLSYTFLMDELVRTQGPEIAAGRVVLAHLGNGASLAAVQHGLPVDTSMGFTPSGGVPMSTRSGDLDPGVFVYLAQTEQMDADQFNTMINTQSGLLGISEISSDLRDLLAQEAHDPRAAEAIEMFCYQIRKYVGALAAALNGLDALVFAGGIGEHAAPVRARICAGLSFLGIELDEAQNAAHAPVISSAASRVRVCVFATDEARVIARAVCRILKLPCDADAMGG
ncbi:MAG: acetate/propionate family kinase [Gammaproteobacteria bacterium]